jgi:hypothetical protein
MERCSCVLAKLAGGYLSAKYDTWLRGVLKTLPHASCLSILVLKEAMADPLFAVRNAFQLGAFNQVINEAADLDSLSEADGIERDCLVYRSYIALGSHEVSSTDR